MNYIQSDGKRSNLAENHNNVHIKQSQNQYNYEFSVPCAVQKGKTVVLFLNHNFLRYFHLPILTNTASSRSVACKIYLEVAVYAIASSMIIDSQSFHLRSNFHFVQVHTNDLIHKQLFITSRILKSSQHPMTDTLPYPLFTACVSQKEKQPHERIYPLQFICSNSSLSTHKNSHALKGLFSSHM